MDKEGLGVLHFAAATESLECLRLVMVHNHQNVNQQCANGATPLYYAAYAGLDNNVHELLKEGADPAIKDKAGKTPFDITSDGACKSLLREVTPGASKAEGDSKPGGGGGCCCAIM